LARQAIVDPDRCGDRVGNSGQQNAGGNGADRSPKRQPGHDCHATDEHRAGIKREPEDYCKDIVPAHGLQLWRHRFDAELLDPLGLTVALPDLFFDF
jgi:hypothetical protein